ncbi:Peptidoglycan-N-acetylmuramic acid deacetylase PdaA precursor [Bacillus sp. THAF10]|uniref:polysaccharide deacetylase family protein n=1 Tax=Bacillus sp. THAF10 TaxID=2587848 RepID=UPI00126865B9|nr:polysaccharide deacetylase family protein [Bacillus sp. THAF10]QFT88916.1 Peptidoglycan-N-acetylmuramic acid deacetylase PdaA precursor [Bacillus sp. THAF10]
MKRRTLQIFAFIVIALFTYKTVNHPFPSDISGHIVNDFEQVSKKQDPLMLEVMEKASAFEVSPQDAKIDKVWKAQPGLNGLKVDVEASYKKMKKTGMFDEAKLVFEQVPPKVHLADLPPSPIYRGHPEKQMVAFLINVAWGNDHIPGMLETLKKHDVKATFFLEGRWVKENPSMAKMIIDAGHEVGNHSYTHPNMKTLGSSAVRDQLMKTNEVIEAISGNKVEWFAPPSGSYRDEVVSIAHELNLKTIMWSVDTIDWQKPAPDVLVNRVMKKIHPGAMILMHPTPSTEQSLETMIVSIKEKGLELGSVTALLDEERIIHHN